MESIQEPATEDTKKEAKHIYVVPGRCVKNNNDMILWEKSEAYFDIVGFINSISQAIQTKKCSDPGELSPFSEKMMNLLDTLDKLLDETPPIDQPQRFGNKAYRDWYEKLKSKSDELLKVTLPEHLHDSIVELGVYFVESFGNSTRIDYGTGHELSFIMFLLGLFKIGALTENDKVVVGVKIFNKYLIFVRKLQLTYRMEPAGSHGVWSLDDYQFVPFIWGSAQLAVNSPIRPDQFLDDQVINDYKSDYIFISCIDYIKQVKTGHFAEHSNQLWGISAVPSWAKINAGLVKMYQKELLGKFPVVQHVLFGSLLEFKPVQPTRLLPAPRLGIMLPPQTKKVI